MVLETRLFHHLYFLLAYYNMERQGLVEFSDIQIHESDRKALCGAEPFVNLLHKENVETSHGCIHVTLQGKEGKPAIVTLHDIGQNHTSAFLGFFNYHDIQPLLEHFCIYHVDAPGQDEASPQLLRSYPTVDELADALAEVLEHFNVKCCIGFGIGVGANVLCRYALRHEKNVEGLVLLNCVTSSMGWVEWGYHKMCIRQLNNKGLTGFVEDYLLWHHFGDRTKENNMDLVNAFKESLRSVFNTHNLSLFIESNAQRSTINIQRPEGASKKGPTIACPTLLIAGNSAPHLDGVVETNSKLDPTNSNLLIVSDCGGMPLEEQPAKVARAFILFLKGLSYVMHLKLGPALKACDVPTFDRPDDGSEDVYAAEISESPAIC